MPALGRSPLKLTLLQVSKLVVFAAVGLGFITPLVRLWQAGAVVGGSAAGLWVVVIFAGVSVPLVWVALAQLLIRRGAWRDGLVRVLLLVAVLVALGFACSILVRFTIPEWRRSPTIPGTPPSLRSLGANLGVIIVLASGAWFLARQLWRGYAGRTGEV